MRSINERLSLEQRARLGAGELRHTWERSRSHLVNILPFSIRHRDKRLRFSKHCQHVRTDGAATSNTLWKSDILHMKVKYRCFVIGTSYLPVDGVMSYHRLLFPWGPSVLCLGLQGAWVVKNWPLQNVTYLWKYLETYKLRLILLKPHYLIPSFFKRKINKIWYS